jgi:hypothetical protein
MHYEAMYTGCREFGAELDAWLASRGAVPAPGLPPRKSAVRGTWQFFEKKLWGPHHGWEPPPSPTTRITPSHVALHFSIYVVRVLLVLAG